MISLEDYGVFASDGVTTFDLTTGSRILQYVGSYFPSSRFDDNGYCSAALGNNFVSGSDVVLVFTTFGGYNSQTSTFNMVDTVSIDKVNGVVGIHFSGNWNTTYSQMGVQFRAYQIRAAGNNPEDYLLQLSDSSNFMEINSQAAVSGLVHKETVTVNGGYTIPQTILTKYPNCILYVSWENPEARMIGGTQNCEFWTRDSGNGALRYTAPIVLDVCVFADNLNLTPPEAGISLYNDAGLCTFSSEYPPICIAGYIPMGGNIGDVHTAVESDVSRIMVNPGIYGLEVWRRGDGWYRNFYGGLIMQGKSIAVSGASQTGGDYNTGQAIPAVVGFSLPYIDRSKYFN